MKNRTTYILPALLGLMLVAAAVAQQTQPSPVTVTGDEVRELAAVAAAPQPTPTPRPSPVPSPTTYPTKGTVDRQPVTPADESTGGRYNIITSIELGARALHVDGNANKY